MNQDEFIHIRITKQVKAKLKVLAHKQGIKFSEYARIIFIQHVDNIITENDFSSHIIETPQLLNSLQMNDVKEVELDTVNQMLKDIAEDIVEYYGFVNHPEKSNMAFKFLHQIKAKQQIGYFQKQFIAFKKYFNDPINAKYKPTLENFIAGKWDSKNWEKEYNARPDKKGIEKYSSFD